MVPTFRAEDRPERPRTPEGLTAAYLPRLAGAATLEELRQLMGEIREQCSTWAVDCGELYSAAMTRRLVLVGTPRASPDADAEPR